MEDLTGRQFGSYRIVAPLGEGGMAAVYRAYQANMNRDVALKVLPKHFASDPEFVARFEQEAKVLARLQHPHILDVYDYGEAEGFTYLVMPYIESGTLINVLEGDVISLEDMKRIISQIGDALDYAHSQGIVHRDVKPSNVLLDKRGNCMLVDFGIAKMIEGAANLTQTGGVIGTPAYMSPEQGRGEKTDHRVDIYALGVILYELATGRVPYKAETPIAILIKHINDPLPPPRSLNPNLPRTVEKVILKAMAKNPDDRFATASEMVEAMEDAVARADEPDISEDKTTPIRSSDLDETPIEPLIKRTPDKSGIPKMGWILGGVGAIALLLVLAACGFLLFNFEQIMQTVAGVEATATPTATRILEPAEVASPTPEPTDHLLNATEVPPEVPPTATAVQLNLSTAETPPDTPAPEATDTVAPTLTPEPTDTPPPSPTPTPPRGFGNPVLTFGDEGIGPGLFEDARSIAVDNTTGNIFVGEYTGGRIQVFDAEGNFQTQWLVDTEMPLRGMDVNRQGQVYIIQSGLIYLYDGQTGELIREIPYDGGWGFDDVIVAPDGGFVAPHYKGSDDIVRFNANGEPTLVIPEAISGQTGDSELDTRVAVDGLGNIYALGSFNEAVLKFGPDGQFLDQFGGGDGPGALDSPHAIAVDGQGRVYVSELVGPIKVYDSGGQLLDTISIQALGMRVDDDGHLYVASRTRVVKFEIDAP